MTLRTSLQLQDITPAGAIRTTLELIISAWEEHEEQEWNLFSWYADLSLTATGLEIKQVNPAPDYANDYFNADISNDPAVIAGLGFTGNPFASKDPNLFRFASIIIELDQAPSEASPLKISLSPVQSDRNQSGDISLETVASSKQLFPGVSPSESGNLALEIGRINHLATSLSTEPLLLISSVDHPAIITSGTSGSGPEDASAITGTLTATDLEGLNDGIIFSIADGNGPTNGTASIHPSSGAWSYTPNANYNGTDAFTVTVTDDLDGTTTQEITVTVNAVDDAALITGETSGSGDEDTSAITGTLVATDVEGLSNATIFSIADGNGPTNGTASIHPSSGAWSYTPNANYNGTDAFTVTVTDDAGSTTPQLIGISIAQKAPRQVTTRTSTITYLPGDDITIPLFYTTNEDQANPMDLSFNIHYNSKWITPKQSDQAAHPTNATFVNLSAPANDTEDLDGDASTDKFIQLTWAARGETLPSDEPDTILATLNFLSNEQIIDPISGLPVQSTLNITTPTTTNDAHFIGGSTSIQASYSFDIDGDGKTLLDSDGLMIVRKLFGAGFAGDALTDGAIADTATRTDSAEIHTWLERGIYGGAFDVDRDGITTALGDGLLILQHLTANASGLDLLLPIQTA